MVAWDDVDVRLRNPSGAFGRCLEGFEQPRLIFLARCRGIDLVAPHDEQLAALQRIAPWLELELRLGKEARYGKSRVPAVAAVGDEVEPEVRVVFLRVIVDGLQCLLIDLPRGGQRLAAVGEFPENGGDGDTNTRLHQLEWIVPPHHFFPLFHPCPPSLCQV